MSRQSIVYSRNWLGIVGYGPGELSDSSNEWLSRVHPDDLERVNTTLAHCLSGASNLFECEHRLRTRDGQWRWVADRVPRSEEDKSELPALIRTSYAVLRLKK